MLPLNDPLWTQLDDAHRDRDIPKLLAKLATAWDAAAANTLLWDCLCHQGSCYGATYAAIPHLLEIAAVEGNRQARLEIAVFAGYVTQCALNSGHKDALPGLPETPEEWDRKLDCFRDPINPPPRYASVLRCGIPADMDRIRSIKADFLCSLPRLSQICEQAFLDNLRNESALTPLLGGLASAEGQLELGALLFSGTDGPLTCAHCGAGYQYILFGNRVALYADDVAGSSMHADSPPNLDFREGAPSRADGFIVPVKDRLTPTTLRLLALADRAQAARPAALLRNFLGSFRCRRCETSVPVCRTI